PSRAIRSHASNRLGEGIATVAGEETSRRHGTTVELAMLNPISSPPVSWTNALLERVILVAMIYPPALIAWAARRTAAKIRTWLPHRQTKLSSASLISSSVGLGFLSSNALVVRTQPFRQYPHWNVCSSINACWTG